METPHPDENGLRLRWGGGLRGLPAFVRLVITFYAAALGLGAVCGFVNIVLSYRWMDGDPSFSIQDAVIFINGGRISLLEAASRGSMREQFADQTDYDLVLSWIHSGAPRTGYDAVASVFRRSCLRCHTSTRGTTTPLATYEDAKRLAEPGSRARDLKSLVRTTHTHLFGFAFMIGSLSVLAALTAVPRRAVLALGVGCWTGMFMDVASWWLGRLAIPFVYVSGAGGALMGAALAGLIGVVVYDAWVGFRTKGR